LHNELGIDLRLDRGTGARSMPNPRETAKLNLRADNYGAHYAVELVTALGMKRAI